MKKEINILILDDNPVAAREAFLASVREIWTDGVSAVSYNNNNIDCSLQVKWGASERLFSISAIGAQRDVLLSKLRNQEFLEAFHLILIDRVWDNIDNPLVNGDFNQERWDQKDDYSYPVNFLHYLRKRIGYLHFQPVIALCSHLPWPIDLIRSLNQKGFHTLLTRTADKGSLLALANVIHNADAIQYERSRRLREGILAASGASLHELLGGIRHQFEELDQYEFCDIIDMLLKDEAEGVLISSIAKELSKKTTVNVSDIKWAKDLVVDIKRFERAFHLEFLINGEGRSEALRVRARAPEEESDER